MSESVLVSTMPKPLRIIRSPTLQQCYASSKNYRCHPFGCIATAAAYGCTCNGDVRTRDTHPVSWCTRIRCACRLLCVPIIHQFWLQQFSYPSYLRRRFLSSVKNAPTSPRPGSMTTFGKPNSVMLTSILARNLICFVTQIAVLYRFLPDPGVPLEIARTEMNLL